MDAAPDMHATARALFLVKITNGAAPEVVTAGKLDGLTYFPIELDGEDYWLTEFGLLTPPAEYTVPEH